MTDTRRVRFAIQGWGGRWEQVAEVVGETPTRWRVRPLPGQSLRLPRRTVTDGDVLIPKAVCRLEPAPEPGTAGTR